MGARTFRRWAIGGTCRAANVLPNPLRPLYLPGSSEAAGGVGLVATSFGRAICALVDSSSPGRSSCSAAGAPGALFMPSYSTADIRNVLLAGHAGSGKTTLVDSLLFASGTVTRKGSVT